MPQQTGQLDSAEATNDVQNPDAVPAPAPETAEEPAQEAPAADAASEPEPAQEVPAADAPSEPEPAEEPAQKDSAADAPSEPAPKKKTPPKRPPPKTTGQLLAGLLIKIAVTAALVWAVLAFVLGVNVHYGNNMYPAIHDGDLVVSLRMQKPFINAAVLYRRNGKTEVGRIIAMEGSVVDIAENGMLTVNNAAPSGEIFYATYQADNSPIQFPYTVEPGKVFILNDFRDDTNDSRVFGAVDKSDLMGPLLFTVRRRNF